LKEFKALNKPVVLGKLGPNIGTKVWKEKKEKMERVKNYSSKINKNKVGLNCFKNSVEDEINKINKNKIEESKNFKSKNYGNIVRNNTFNYKKMEDVINKENDNFNIKRFKTNKNEFKKNLEILNENEEINNNIENLFNKKNIYSQEINEIRNSLIN
jgi:hypothetical protein